MSKATDTFRISDYIRNPSIRAAFERAERDLPSAPVAADCPRPVLSGSDAVRVLEVA
jgi:hypothetical protein